MRAYEYISKTFQRIIDDRTKMDTIIRSNMI
jgi:hypothetical protein